MKEIMIIVRPRRYFKTKEILSEHRFYAMSTKEVLGRGKNTVKYMSADEKATYDAAYENSLVAKKMIEMVVPDKDVDEVVRLVLQVNQSGNEGDGKIFVLPVNNSFRIHTGESGDDALI
ncbi:MAG: P-II family nitrogen regulator [Eubacterium sp.]|nr:P-II family nitrogen regulator [Eubacterium sp.]